MGAFCAPVRVVVPHLSCPTLPPCHAQAYEAGDWTKATSRLFECQKILKDDFPARALINVMSRFNFNAPADWSGSRHLTEK